MSLIERRLRAQLGGYFWMPCPHCGNYFGGNEWRQVGGHFDSLPEDPYPEDPPGIERAVGICPDCTYAGVGCKAFAEQRRRWHAGCEAVDPPDGRPYSIVDRPTIVSEQSLARCDLGPGTNSVYWP